MMGPTPTSSCSTFNDPLFEKLYPLLYKGYRDKQYHYNNLKLVLTYNPDIKGFVLFNMVTGNIEHTYLLTDAQYEILKFNNV